METKQIQPAISIRYNVSARFPNRVYFTVMQHGEPVEYRTDGNREGLWQVFPHSDDKQVLGSCQFSLTGNRSTDRKRIARDVQFD